MRQRFKQADEGLTASLRALERPGFLRTMAAILAHSGDSWFWLLGLALVWLFGPPNWRSLAQIFALSVIGLAALVLLIKFAVRRKRPTGEWGEIYRRTDPHSFPSGHAARAALLAVLALGLGPGWLGALLAAWAPLVAVARVGMGLHYISDILAGAVIGALMGIAVVWLV